jgi:hypothetical protein
LQKIRLLLPDVSELREPPVDPDPDEPRSGITVWQFPEWFITQDILHTHPRFGRARRLVHRRLLEKNQYLDDDRNKHPVVPVRFVRACPKGHIGEIDWYFFVHEGETSCQRKLWIDEQGTSGDIASLWVRCDCGRRRSLAQAADHKRFKALRYCDGGRPWLGGYRTQEECHELNRLLIRSASHAYFPQLLSVISLPLQQNDPVAAAVAAAWDSLQRVDSVEKLNTLRKLGVADPPLARSRGPSRLHPFRGRRARHRRRTGHRRGTGRAGRGNARLPAIENRGEGLFIGFQREAVQRWLRQSAVTERHIQLLQGFQCWLAEHPGSKRIFPGAAYLMLHTLSHLLLTVISLECGYPASAIRERVYASELGYGILLYTASADAEGTLGGLMKAGERIHHHLRAALDWGRLYGNDPVCAQHKPDDPHERRFLHGAACHGCLLIAETSCEQFNDFLDRTLVIPTVDRQAAAFFADA